MKRTAMTPEERINARVQAMKAHRKSTQRKKAVPVIVTSICAMALLAGGTVFGVSMLNSNTKQTQAVQPTAAAKNVSAQDAAQKTAAVNTNTNTAQTAQTGNTYTQNSESYTQTCNTQATYDADTDSYVYTYDYTDYTDNNADQGDNGAQQTAYTGTHHSGANWNGTGSPLHFYENGKTSYGYNWRYEGGNGLVDLGCDYTFDGSSYDFSLIGKEPGSGSITVWHNTGNNTQEPTTINFTVDDDLNVTYN